MTEEDADSVIFSNNADLFGLSMAATDMNEDGKDDLWVASVAVKEDLVSEDSSLQKPDLL